MNSNMMSNQNLRVQGFAAGLRIEARRVASVRVQTTQQGPRPCTMFPLKFPRLRRAQSAVTLDEVRKRVWTPYAVDVVVSRLRECGISADDTAAILWKQRHDDTVHEQEQTPASHGQESGQAEEENGDVFPKPNSNNPSRNVNDGKSDISLQVSEEKSTISAKESKSSRKFVRATRSAPVRRVCHVCGGCLPSHDNGKNTTIRSTYPTLPTTDNHRKTVIRPMTADVKEIKGILKRLDNEEDRVKDECCQFPEREVSFRLEPTPVKSDDNLPQCSCGTRTSFEVLSASPGRQLKRENGRYKPCTMTMTFPGRKMWNLDDCTQQLGQPYYAYRAQRLKQQGELRNAIAHEKRLQFERVAGDKSDLQNLTNGRTKSARTLTRRSVSSMF